MTRFKRSTLALLAFVAGWACGGGGSDGIAAVMRLLELGGASLADMLAQAGPPPISAGLGIAEIVPDDGTRHFALTVASENRSSKEDTAALYALMDGHGPIGGVWGANILAFAHSDMTSGSVQGLEIDVGNFGAAPGVPVAGINVFAMGPVPADVALGILSFPDPSGPGGFREGIAFRSHPGGPAVTDALLRVHPGFGRVETGIDLRAATFSGPALATPGFSVGPDGAIASQALATGETRFACVDPEGRLFASATPCVP